jgi:hypothetical protein
MLIYLVIIRIIFKNKIQNYKNIKWNSFTSFITLNFQNSMFQYIKCAKHLYQNQTFLYNISLFILLFL